MGKAIDQKRICVGVITGSHGLEGHVKIKSFMVVPEDIAAYGPLTDKSGKQNYELDIISSNKRGLVAELIGINNRDASDNIKGLELYLLRDLLPILEEDEFYYTDLVGLSVKNINGKLMGIVRLVDNYGAGEVMEVDLLDGGTEMYKVCKEVVREIDLKKGCIIIDPPNELFAQKNENKNEDGVGEES